MARTHNGGTIILGPDGYAYFALGDGGNANDVGPSHSVPEGNAQNLTTPLGKMLRIGPLNPALNSSSPDPVSRNGQYRIPTTNPLQGAGQAPEIYAYGLRNPYRFCFDTVTGDLIEADVDQNDIEEINRIRIGGNYGWAVKHKLGRSAECDDDQSSDCFDQLGQRQRVLPSDHTLIQVDNRFGEMHRRTWRS